jgi:hypothetical protein
MMFAFLIWIGDAATCPPPTALQSTRFCHLLHGHDRLNQQTRMSFLLLLGGFLLTIHNQSPPSPLPALSHESLLTAGCIVGRNRLDQESIPVWFESSGVADFTTLFLDLEDPSVALVLLASSGVISLIMQSVVCSG